MGSVNKDMESVNKDMESVNKDMETLENPSNDNSISQLDEEKKFFVANMAFNLTAEQVKAWFTDFGPVQFVKIIYDKNTGKSKGFGFVYMQTSEGVQAVDDFATERGYRVEMFGRENVQLHKHMTDRSKLFPQRPSSSMRRSSGSNRVYSKRNQPMETSTSTFSRASSSDPNSSTSMVYPANLIPSQRRPYVSSTQNTEVDRADPQAPYSANMDLDHSLHSLQYYYTPVVASATTPYYFPSQQGTLNMYPSSEVVAYNTSYSVPMYTMTNDPFYGEYTRSYPTSMKPPEPSPKDADPPAAVYTVPLNDKSQKKTHGT